MKKKVLIIEDEPLAAVRLENLILELRPEYQCLAKLPSISETVRWFGTNESPDLIFLDIHLTDGLSFTIFNQIKIDVPIIFTTAYDQYALRAFKVNSVDYLLKPVEAEAMECAITKFENRGKEIATIPTEIIDQLINSIYGKKYRTRFLVKMGNVLEYLTNEQICFFYSEEGIVFARSMANKRYMIDSSLEQVESSLNPSLYFRINRKVIIHIQAIGAVHPYLNSRFKIECPVSKELDLIVARERASSFRHWLDQDSK